MLGFFCSSDRTVVFVLGSFGEHVQWLKARRLRQVGMRRTMVDLYSGQTIIATEEL